jgi:hypothetical protein
MVVLQRPVFASTPHSPKIIMIISGAPPRSPQHWPKNVKQPMKAQPESLF